jgi:hypothetical protein
MAFFFIVAAVILRLMPHLPNFAPIAALALFGGTYLNKKYALGVPILAMLISDYLIGFYNPWIMLSVYGSFVLIGLIGLWLKKHKTIPNVLGASIFGSIIFFLITNFAVWAVPHSMYPHNLQGLLQSYIMGLPFLKNTLAGDLFYVATMFGLYELVLWLTLKRRVVCPVKSKN